MGFRGFHELALEKLSPLQDPVCRASLLDGYDLTVGLGGRIGMWGQEFRV